MPRSRAFQQHFPQQQQCERQRLDCIAGSSPPEACEISASTASSSPLPPWKNQAYVSGRQNILLQQPQPPQQQLQERQAWEPERDLPQLAGRALNTTRTPHRVSSTSTIEGDKCAVPPWHKQPCRECSKTQRNWQHTLHQEQQVPHRNRLQRDEPAPSRPTQRRHEEPPKQLCPREIFTLREKQQQCGNSPGNCREPDEAAAQHQLQYAAAAVRSEQQQQFAKQQHEGQLTGQEQRQFYPEVEDCSRARVQETGSDSGAPGACSRTAEIGSVRCYHVELLEDQDGSSECPCNWRGSMRRKTRLRHDSRAATHEVHLVDGTTTCTREIHRFASQTMSLRKAYGAKLTRQSALAGCLSERKLSWRDRHGGHLGSNDYGSAPNSISKRGRSPPNDGNTGKPVRSNREGNHGADLSNFVRCSRSSGFTALHSAWHERGAPGEDDKDTRRSRSREGRFSRIEGSTTSCADGNSAWKAAPCSAASRSMPVTCAVPQRPTVKGNPQAPQEEILQVHSAVPLPRKYTLTLQHVQAQDEQSYLQQRQTPFPENRPSDTVGWQCATSCQGGRLLSSESQPQQHDSIQGLTAMLTSSPVVSKGRAAGAAGEVRETTVSPLWCVAGSTLTPAEAPVGRTKCNSIPATALNSCAAFRPAAQAPANSPIHTPPLLLVASDHLHARRQSNAAPVCDVMQLDSARVADPAVTAAVLEGNTEHAGRAAALAATLPCKVCVTRPLHRSNDHLMNLRAGPSCYGKSLPFTSSSASFAAVHGAAKFSPAASHSLTAVPAGACGSPAASKGRRGAREGRERRLSRQGECVQPVPREERGEIREGIVPEEPSPSKVYRPALEERRCLNRQELSLYTESSSRGCCEQGSRSRYEAQTQGDCVGILEGNGSSSTRREFVPSGPTRVDTAKRTRNFWQADARRRDMRGEATVVYCRRTPQGDHCCCCSRCHSRGKNGLRCCSNLPNISPGSQDAIKTISRRDVRVSVRGWWEPGAHRIPRHSRDRCPRRLHSGDTRKAAVGRNRSLTSCGNTRRRTAGERNDSTCRSRSTFLLRRRNRQLRTLEEASGCSEPSGGRVWKRTPLSGILHTSTEANQRTGAHPRAAVATIAVANPDIGTTAARNAVFRGTVPQHVYLKSSRKGGKRPALERTPSPRAAGAGLASAARRPPGSVIEQLRETRQQQVHAIRKKEGAARGRRICSLPHLSATTTAHIVPAGALAPGTEAANVTSKVALPHALFSSTKRNTSYRCQRGQQQSRWPTQKRGSPSKLQAHRTPVTSGQSGCDPDRQKTQQQQHQQQPGDYERGSERREQRVQLRQPKAAPCASRFSLRLASTLAAGVRSGAQDECTPSGKSSSYHDDKDTSRHPSFPNTTFSVGASAANHRSAVSCTRALPAAGRGPATAVHLSAPQTSVDRRYSCFTTRCKREAKRRAFSSRKESRPRLLPDAGHSRCHYEKQSRLRPRSTEHKLRCAFTATKMLQRSRTSFRPFAIVGSWKGLNKHFAPECKTPSPPANAAGPVAGTATPPAVPAEASDLPESVRFHAAVAGPLSFTGAAAPLSSPAAVPTEAAAGFSALGTPTAEACSTAATRESPAPACTAALPTSTTPTSEAVTAAPISLAAPPPAAGTRASLAAAVAATPLAPSSPMGRSPSSECIPAVSSPATEPAAATSIPVAAPAEPPPPLANSPLPLLLPPTQESLAAVCGSSAALQQ